MGSLEAAFVDRKVLFYARSCNSSVIPANIQNAPSIGFVVNIGKQEKRFRDTAYPFDGFCQRRGTPLLFCQKIIAEEEQAIL